MTTYFSRFSDKYTIIIMAYKTVLRLNKTKLVNSNAVTIIQNESI